MIPQLLLTGMRVSIHPYFQLYAGFGSQVRPAGKNDADFCPKRMNTFSPSRHTLKNPDEVYMMNPKKAPGNHSPMLLSMPNDKSPIPSDLFTRLVLHRRGDLHHLVSRQVTARNPVFNAVIHPCQRLQRISA